MMEKRRLRNVLAGVLARELPPPPPDPSEATARSLMLDRMLEKLNPKKRMVLVLFELEGVPVEEISRIVGCPTNTVWSRLHHARLDLTRMARKEVHRRVGVKHAAVAEQGSQGSQGSIEGGVA